jgi:hypothetical protein
MTDKYDSKADTLEHIKKVNSNILEVVKKLLERAAIHDKSKLEAPEKEYFDEMTPKLKGLTYGSEEYNDALESLKPALNHHYENNPHHPEYYSYFECFGCFKRFNGQNSTQYTEYKNVCEVCGSTTGIERPFVDGMNLIDIMEMFCDWLAAVDRHDDGCIFDSIKINKERFTLSPQLESIFMNTARNSFGRVKNGK